MATTTSTGLIKAQALKEGDKIAVISLSCGSVVPSSFPKRFFVGCEQLSDAFNIEVIPSKNALKDPSWLAANPQARADDLIESLEDKLIKGIICSIGGEDSIRVNELVKPEIIRSNPKVFIGYSDATTTHHWFLKAGVVSFYGPSIMAGFAENTGLFGYMEEYFRRAVFQTQPIGLIKPNNDGWTSEFLDWSIPKNQGIKRKLLDPVPPICLQGEGKIQGHLIGGCAAVLDLLSDTTHWPEKRWFDNAILFIETTDANFSPVNLASTVRNYGSMGILNQLSAILVGRPGGNLSIEQFPLYYEALQRVVAEEFDLRKLPIICNMDFGHTDPMFTIPYGVQAEIDCSDCTLLVLESGVC